MIKIGLKIELDFFNVNNNIVYSQAHKASKMINTDSNNLSDLIPVSRIHGKFIASSSDGFDSLHKVFKNGATEIAIIITISDIGYDFTGGRVIVNTLDGKLNVVNNPHAVVIENTMRKESASYTTKTSTTTVSSGQKIEIKPNTHVPNVSVIPFDKITKEVPPKQQHQLPPSLPMHKPFSVVRDDADKVKKVSEAIRSIRRMSENN